MGNNKRILCWADNPIAMTGYGVVTRHVLRALHNAGYIIEQLGINYHANFFDSNVVPWQMIPARYMEPSDPYGCKMFVECIKNRDYDYVWILNDYFVVNEIGKEIDKIRSFKLSQNRPVPKFIYYYPIDYKLLKGHAGMVENADVPVVYNQYGFDRTVEACPEVKDRLKIIPHGVDHRTFKPLAPQIQDHIKRQSFGVDPETYMVLAVGRNSIRKQIPYSILAFEQFKRRVPNSVMYIHTMIQDHGGDIEVAVNDTGLDPTKDVILPRGYTPQNGIPDEILNQIYNASDMYLTTALGEGWGLCQHESMAAGTPVVAPNNSNSPDLFGNKSERGYMYQCRDRLFVDNQGMRPKGYLDDIVAQMVRCYKAGSKWNNNKTKLARRWAEEHSWDVACKMWVDLFKELDGEDKSKFQKVELMLEGV